MRRACRKCGAPAVVQRAGLKQTTRCTVCNWSSVKFYVSKGST